MANTNAKIVAEYTDRYGDTRKIHQTRHGLKVKRENTTVALQLNQLIGIGIGQNIKRTREQRGMTLEQLCVKAGLASATPKSRMWEIENSIRKEGIRLGTLYAIAFALGVEPQELLPSLSEMLIQSEVKEAMFRRLEVEV